MGPLLLNFCDHFSCVPKYSVSVVHIEHLCQSDRPLIGSCEPPCHLSHFLRPRSVDARGEESNPGTTTKARKGRPPKLLPAQPSGAHKSAKRLKLAISPPFPTPSAGLPSTPPPRFPISKPLSFCTARERARTRGARAISAAAARCRRRRR